MCIIQLVILAICFAVALSIVQGLPAVLEEQPTKKEFRQQPLGPASIRKEEESQEAGDEEKDLTSSNTFGFGYYAYPRYRSYYPGYYSGYGGYRSYGYGGYGGYFSPYRYYGGYY